jgi:hypothetical protein
MGRQPLRKVPALGNLRSASVVLPAWRGPRRLLPEPRPGQRSALTEVAGESSMQSWHGIPGLHSKCGEAGNQMIKVKVVEQVREDCMRGFASCRSFAYHLWGILPITARKSNKC